MVSPVFYDPENARRDGSSAPLDNVVRPGVPSGQSGVADRPALRRPGESARPRACGLTAVGAALGYALPVSRQHHDRQRRDSRACWLGPDEWLLDLRRRQSAAELIQRLSLDALAGHAYAVTDITDAAPCCGSQAPARVRCWPRAAPRPASRVFGADRVAQSLVAPRPGDDPADRRTAATTSSSPAASPPICGPGCWTPAPNTGSASRIPTKGLDFDATSTPTVRFSEGDQDGRADDVQDRGVLRIARVSGRLLRYYDSIGLWSPQHVDPATGYRYYTAGQLERLNRILALKDLGLSLDQVARMIDGKSRPSRSAAC